MDDKKWIYGGSTFTIDNDSMTIDKSLADKYFEHRSMLAKRISDYLAQMIIKQEWIKVKKYNSGDINCLCSSIKFYCTVYDEHTTAF